MGQNSSLDNRFSLLSQELMETEEKRHQSFKQYYLLAASTLHVSFLLLENVLGLWAHWTAQTLSMASNSSLNLFCVKNRENIYLFGFF